MAIFTKSASEMAREKVRNNGHRTTQNGRETPSNPVGSGNRGCKGWFGFGKDGGKSGNNFGGYRFTDGGQTRTTAKTKVSNGTRQALPTVFPFLRYEFEFEEVVEPLDCELQLELNGLFP